MFSPLIKEVSNEGTVKTTPLSEGPLRDKVLEGNKTPTDMEPINPTIADLLGTSAEYQDEMAQESDDEQLFAAGEDMDEDTQAAEEEHYPKLKKYENILPLTERQLVKYLKEVSRVLFKRIIEEQGDLLNALNGVTETLKAIHDAVKEDPPINKKATIRTEVSFLRQDTSDIKSMMTTIYQTFKEAEKIRIYPKKVISAKACEKLKKAQDAEMQVHKRQHTEKVKRLTKLNKKRAEQYKWTISSRLKPKPITDVKIHPNSKPALLTIYRNNDKRNFVVHNPFKIVDFRLTELDELGQIIEKKNNFIFKDLMQSLRRKRKHMELEPQIKVHRLKCNRSLLEGVLFVNNMVIEEPEYWIFFTDVFGDQAF
nr:hypothetical protein [Tanacetum cinerariifolium]